MKSAKPLKTVERISLPRRVSLLRGWRFTAWKSEDPSNEEYQGVGRKGDKMVIARSWHCTKKEAMQAAREVVVKEANDQALRPLGGRE